MPPTPRTPAEIDDLAAELHYIKSHTLYRLGQRLRASGWWHRLRSLRGGDRRVVTVDALDTHNAAAKGGEAWLLYAAGSAGGRSVPWEFLEHRGNWHAHPASGRPYGKCLVAQGPGVLRVPVEMATAQNVRNGRSLSAEEAAYAATPASMAAVGLAMGAA